MTRFTSKVAAREKECKEARVKIRVNRYNDFRFISHYGNLLRPLAFLISGESSGNNHFFYNNFVNCD